MDCTSPLCFSCQGSVSTHIHIDEASGVLSQRQVQADVSTSGMFVIYCAHCYSLKLFQILLLWFQYLMGNC